MPYIGKSPVGGGFHKLDALTASATATYSLTLGGASYFPETANQLLVSLNGVIQAPQDSFTVSGSNLVFDSALTSSDSIDFVVALGDVLGVGSVTDGAITTAKIGNDAVTKAKIGTTELDLATIKDSTGTNTAMTIDSDGRVGFNNPILFWGQLSNTSPFAPTSGDLLSFRDDVDTASGWNSSNKYYVVPKAGYYEVHCTLLMNSQASAGNLDFLINKNGVNNFIARGFTSAGASDYQPVVASVIHQFAVNDQISIQSRSTVEIWAAVNTVSSADVSSLSIKFLG